MVGVCFFLFFVLSLNLNAHSWNLVWREDFGVAEDTIIKNFADQSNSVRGHCFVDFDRFCNDDFQWDATLILMFVMVFMIADILLSAIFGETN